MVIALSVFLALSMVGCAGGCEKEYGLSGKVVDPDGVGIAGVVLAYTGQNSGTVKTDGSGNWSITGLKGIATISLSHDRWYFNPSQYTVTKEQSNLKWVGVPVLTDELGAQLENTRNEVDDLFSRVYNPDNPEDSLAQIAQEASSNPGVDWVRSDSHSLVLEHKNGGVEIWCITPEAVPPPWAPRTIVGTGDDRLYARSTPGRTLPGNNRAAVIYTYDDDVGMDHHDAGVEEVIITLGNAGYAVEPVRGPNADVAFFKRLNDYGLVYIQTDGNQYQDRSGYGLISLMTGETYDPNSSGGPNWELWQRGRLTIRRVGWGPQQERRHNLRSFWAINDLFIEDFLPSFPGTLCISGAPHTLANESMALELLMCGAQAVVGWTGKTDIGPQSTSVLVGLMKGGMSLREALTAMPDDIKRQGSGVGESLLSAEFRSDDADIYLVAEPDDAVPQVEIISPVDGSTTEQLRVVVTGRISPVGNGSQPRAVLTVNGLSSALSYESNGAFSQAADLNPGANTIQVTAYGTAGTGTQTIHVTAELPDLDLWTRLVWNTNGTDVDFHMYPESSSLSGADDCYYSRKNTAWGGHLDVDDTNGFGPEHITGTTIQDGTYILAVHFYSPHGVIDPTTAQVWVRTENSDKHYSRGGLTQRGNVWTVCKITFPGGYVEDIDTFAESLPPNILQNIMEKDKVNSR